MYSIDYSNLVNTLVESLCIWSHVIHLLYKVERCPFVCLSEARDLGNCWTDYSVLLDNIGTGPLVVLSYFHIRIKDFCLKLKILEIADPIRLYFSGKHLQMP